MPKYGDQVTGGSTQRAHCGSRSAQAGAAAREMLLGAAARSWGVPRPSARRGGGADGGRADGAYGSWWPSPPCSSRRSRREVAGEFRLLGRRSPTARRRRQGRRDGPLRHRRSRAGACSSPASRAARSSARKITGYGDGRARAVPGVRDVVRFVRGDLVGEFWRFPLPRGRRSRRRQPLGGH